MGKKKTNRALITKRGFTTGCTCRKATYLYVLKRYKARSTKDGLTLLNENEFKGAASSFLNATYNVKYSTDPEKMAEETKKAMEDGHKTISGATFIWNLCCVVVDILTKNEDSSLTIYEAKSESEANQANEDDEAKSKSKVNEINRLDVAFQYTVLRELGYKIKKVNLIHANGNYSFKKGENIDFKQFFIIEDMTADCEELLPTVKGEIEAISEAIKTKTKPDDDFSSNCKKEAECPFMEYCISEANLPENTNIFCINGAQLVNTKLNKWYKKGIKTYQDLVTNVQPKYKRNGEPKDATWKFIQQASCYLEEKDAPVQMEKLGGFLEIIKYPVASFDYEGFKTAIPRYYGLKPHQQVPFQFSYHYVEYKGAPIQHYEFLAEPGTDPRKNLCKALSKLPKAETILVWNATYERFRNLELSELEGLEKYKDMLLEMITHMVDLGKPFKERIIYPWKTNGSWSLKPVTEAIIPTLRYCDLKVHNGTEAAEQFMKMINMTASEKKKCIQSLKMYNNQDTYGPLKILEVLYRIYLQDDSFVLFTELPHKDMKNKQLHIGDTVMCDEGVAVITRFTDQYVYAMLMQAGKEVKRKGNNLVLIQDYVKDKDKPRDIATTGTPKYGDIVVCNKGIGYMFGKTPCFIRIKLFDGEEIIRMKHKIYKLSF